MTSLAYRKRAERISSQLLFCNDKPPDIAVHLENVVSLCRRSWVTDFLFDPDPTHLPVVTAPLFKHSALTFDYQRALFEPSTLPHSEGFQHEVSAASIVILPGVSVDGLSTGFGIAENSVKLTQDLSGYFCDNLPILRAPSMDQFRYVVDEAEHAYLMVFEVGDSVLIEYIKQICPQRRQRSITKLKRGDLIDLLKSSPAQMSARRLLRSTEYFNVIDEFRRCPTCGVHPGSSCKCRLFVPATKHPLDFSNLSQKLQLLLGAFEGMAHCMSYADGTPLSQQVRGVKVSCVGTANRGLVDKLTRASVTNYLLSVGHDPLASVFPTAHGAPREQGRIGVLGDGYMTPKAPIVLGAAGAQECDALGWSGESEQACAGLPYGGEAPNTECEAENLPSASSNAQLAHPEQDLAQSLGLVSSGFLLDPADSPITSREPQAGPVVSNMLERAPVANSMTTAEETRRRKRELKKERDRQAARRSNEKKRKYIADLRTNIKVEKKKAADLREQDILLRKDNQKLRAAVFGPPLPDGSSS